MAPSKPLPARASLLWVKGQDQSPRQALTAQQGSGGAGGELQREPQGGGSELRQHQATLAGSVQLGICLPGPSTPSLSPSVDLDSI